MRGPRESALCRRTGGEKREDEAMGFIDSDTHVLECDETWDYFDPSERDYKPITLEYPAAEGPGAGSRNSYYVIGDTLTRKFAPDCQTWGYGKDYTAEVSYLRDTSVRLQEMDTLGIDVQVLFSTDYLTVGIENPRAEAALTRSYNRWVADKTSDTAGRLRWTIVPPTLDMDRCFEELEFGANNGACGVMLKGTEHGRSLADPYFHPMYRKAEELDLTICVHVGFVRQRMEGLPISKSMPSGGNLLQQGFGSILMAGAGTAGGTMRQGPSQGLHDVFPKLRFAFLEGGSAWLPGVFEARKRARSATNAANWVMTERGTSLVVDDLDAAAEMRAHNLYVAGFRSEDLGYLASYVGEDSLIMGTDYCHNDTGTDPLAHTLIMENTDLDPVVARKICDDNGRAAYNIPADFTPTGPTRVAASAAV
jgi:predicted TIM-barrel fold metal-dependent hydrolase